MEVFHHGDADAGVEGIAGCVVAAEGELGGDGAEGDTDEGAGGAGEVECGGGVAEEGFGELRAVWFRGTWGREEVGSGELEAAARDGRAGAEGGEVRGVGAEWMEQGHEALGYARGWGDANEPFVLMRLQELEEVGDEGAEGEGDEAGRYVVEHDAGAVGEGLELADGPWFEDVEETEEDECEQGVHPVGAHEDEGEELAGDLIDDDKTGVLAAGLASDDVGGVYADDHEDVRRHKGRQS